MEFVARDRKAFQAILNDKTIKVSEKGKDKKDDLEREIKKFKEGLRFEQVHRGVAMNWGMIRAGALLFGFCGVAAAQFNLAVTPTSGTGGTQTFSVTLTSGAPNVDVVLFVGNDFQPSWFLASCGNSASVNDCMLRGTSSASRSGSAMTVNFVLSFRPSSYTPRDIWVYASEEYPGYPACCTDSGWQYKGTWRCHRSYSLPALRG